MYTKKELRKSILKKRASMSRESVEKFSQIICNRLTESDIYKSAENICLYIPIKNEVEVTYIIDAAIDNGKRIWLPRIIEDTMEFYHYDRSVTLIPDHRYNIPEPQSDRRLIPDNKTLIIMPGAVFSVKRDRIGYGGGYYDRYLSKYPICRTAAVCYNFQIVDNIPSDVHDVKPDVIVSEAATIEL